MAGPDSGSGVIPQLGRTAVAGYVHSQAREQVGSLHSRARQRWRGNCTAWPYCGGRVNCTAGPYYRGMAIWAMILRWWDIHTAVVGPGGYLHSWSIHTTQYLGVLQPPQCCKLQLKNKWSCVQITSRYCNLQKTINMLVCCSLPSVVNQNRKSKILHTGTSRMLQITTDNQLWGVLQTSKCNKL